jgi:hypothetical protein
MNRINQESVARRFQSFDTELPRDVRAELGRPRLARVIGHQERSELDPATDTRLILLAFLVLMFAAGAIATWLHRSSPSIEQKGPPSPRQSATPIPMPIPHTSWQSDLAAHQTSAPRAELVKLAPPRAQLIKLPEWRVGETRPVMMPYGVQALAKYKGRLLSEDMLPQSGNAIGDALAVGDNVWVWIVTPGRSAAQWVDP